MSTKINWYPGHMKKATDNFFSIIKNVHIVLNVIDGRAPISSNNNDLLKKIPNNKIIINIISKIDLITESQIKIIKENFDMNNTILFSINKKHVFKKKILSLLSKISTKNIYKICVVIGISNVGKSTIINALLDKNKVKSQNLPGTTKKISMTNLGKNIFILDTPGITQKNIIDNSIGYKLVLINSIKRNVVDIQSVLNFAYNYLKNNNYEFLKNLSKENDTMNCSFEKYLEIISKKIKNSTNDENITYNFILKKIFSARTIMWDLL